MEPKATTDLTNEHETNLDLALRDLAPEIVKRGYEIGIYLASKPEVLLYQENNLDFELRRWPIDPTHPETIARASLCGVPGGDGGEIMKWGTFSLPNGVHACPCAEDGSALPPHELTPACECQPTIKVIYTPWPRTGTDRPVILHHDFH